MIEDKWLEWSKFPLVAYSCDQDMFIAKDELDRYFVGYVDPYMCINFLSMPDSGTHKKLTHWTDFKDSYGKRVQWRYDSPVSPEKSYQK